jgi:hypothetical protein
MASVADHGASGGHDRPRTQPPPQPEPPDVLGAFDKLAENPSLRNVAPTMGRIVAEAARVHKLQPDDERPGHAAAERAASGEGFGMEGASEAAAARLRGSR